MLAKHHRFVNVPHATLYALLLHTLSKNRQKFIKTLTGLGYTVTSSISRRPNLTLNDDISDKTRDSFIHRKGNFDCEGGANQIVSL